MALFAKNVNTFSHKKKLKQDESRKRHEVLRIIPKVIDEIDRRMATRPMDQNLNGYAAFKEKLFLLQSAFQEDGWFNVELEDLLDRSSEQFQTQRLLLVDKFKLITLFAFLCSGESISSLKVEFTRHRVNLPLAIELFYEHRRKRQEPEPLTPNALRAAFIFRMGEA